MQSKSESFLVSNSLFSQEESKSINQQSISRPQAELERMHGLLNSQRIEKIFGHYAVEVLLQNAQVRVANLNSNRVMRTCAVVNYSETIPNWLKGTHDKIFTGGSIGQTIKDDKFDLRKCDTYYGVCTLPAFAKAMMETVEDKASIHIYQLHVTNSETSESCLYCTITEVHSPLYLTLGDLKVISPSRTEDYQVITDTVKEKLEAFMDLDKQFSPFQINTI